MTRYVDGFINIQTYKDLHAKKRRNQQAFYMTEWRCQSLSIDFLSFP